MFFDQIRKTTYDFYVFTVFVLTNMIVNDHLLISKIFIQHTLKTIQGEKLKSSET
jgi:hypothetical protein